MDKVIKEMQELKESIDQASHDVANTEGRVSSSLERLKKELKQPSLEVAKKKVGKNKETLQSLEREITEKFSKLREEYEF